MAGERGKIWPPLKDNSFRTSRPEVVALDEKLSELEKFRAGAGYGLNEEELNKKFSDMVSTFEEGFGSTPLEAFSKADLLSDLEALRFDVRSSQIKLWKLSALLDKTINKLTPFKFPNDSKRDPSDTPESMNLDGEEPPRWRR